MKKRNRGCKMYDPQDDDGRCEICGRDYDSHTAEQHDECDLKDALEEMPKDGLWFLALRKPEQLKKIPDFGSWEWTDLDGVSDKDYNFVKMAVKDGEILEDLG